MSPQPGVEYRVPAIHGYTFGPGSCPPSPGFAPCAILIWMSSALTRYSLVTPNRPLATCLIAERRRSPFGSGVNRSGAPPPSPGFGVAAQRVHGDRQRLVGLLRDRAVAHRAGGEALDDLADRLDLLQRKPGPRPG